MQAAFLLAKLPHVDRWNAARRALARRYRAAWAHIPGIAVPDEDGEAHVWHLFVLRCPQRDALAAALQSAGVSTQVHYPVPPHRSGAYANHPWPPLPLAEQLAGDALSVPLYPGMREDHVARIIEAVADFRVR